MPYMQLKLVPRLWGLCWATEPDTFNSNCDDQRVYVGLPFERAAPGRMRGDAHLRAKSPGQPVRAERYHQN